MRPYLHIKSIDNDSLLESIISCVQAMDCTEHFSAHLEMHQIQQKGVVTGFQKKLIDRLNVDLPSIKWRLEYSPSSSSKDAIDIFGQFNDSVVVIELDKHRADQVAKKFISRTAMLSSEKVYFLSLCYPGTAGMNITECVKYFGYCSVLSQRIGNVYAGLIISKGK